MQINKKFKELLRPQTIEEREALKKDIEENGQRDPIIVREETDEVVDGHNRLAVLEDLKITPSFKKVSLPTDQDVITFIYRNQKGRRNLNAGEMAALEALTNESYGADKVQAKQARLLTEQQLKDVVAGKTTLIKAFTEYKKKEISKRAPRGPSKNPHIPQGHELKAQSTLVDSITGEEKSRWDKTHIASKEEAHEPPPDDHLVKKTATLYGPDGQIRSKWVSTEKEKSEQWEAFKTALADHVEQYRGLIAPVKRPKHSDSDLLVVYPLGDPHIGMLSWAPETGKDFDLKIATRELLTCVRLMVDGAPASERAIVTNLGDFFHAQDSKAQTPKGGNRLDTDGRYSKILQAGFDLMRDIIKEALKKHEYVHVRNLPGNHDPEKAVAIAYTIKAWFDREKRVIVEPSEAPYQYDTFGKNLIGWAHGDGAKSEKLPSIMASDRAKEWGDSVYRVWHTGHVHHLSKKEFPGCIVESHRTMAYQDFWHSHQGYRAAQSLDAICYHSEFGEVSRQTVNLKRVQQSLGKSK